METKTLIENLLDLQEKYSFVKRNLITADRYEQIALTGLVDSSDYDNEVLREPLIEHVGHLPILATFLHPHIEHSDTVDLGRVLMMLAIHDIGETEVGDAFSYSKKVSHEDAEFEAAMKLLTSSQKDVYVEYEERKTLEAKYAKTIDALAPIVHTMYRPQIKIQNFKRMGAVIQDIIDHKEKYFTWDAVLNDIFKICIDHYQRVEQGREPIFLVK